MSDHLSGEILAAIADGRLAAGARRAAESHLSHCRECRQELAELVEVLAGREDAPGEFVERALDMAGKGAARLRPAPGARAIFLRPAFGVAAVFLVAVVAGYFFLGRGRVQAPPTAERELPGQFREPKAKQAPAEASSLKDATPATRDEALSRQGGARVARQDETVSGTTLEKAVRGSGLPAQEELAARKGEGRPTAPTILAEAPQAVPAAADRYQAADKREAAEAGVIADGVVGGVASGSVEAQAPEKAKLAAAPGPETRRRDLEAMAQAEPRLTGPGNAGSLRGARQLFLAASGRAAAPPSVELIELAAGALVNIEGDIAAADVLPPGLRGAWEWLPAGAAVEVSIGAAGEVTSVRLLGEWHPGAAARARAAAARLEFLPAAAAQRRAVISRPRLN